MGNPLLQPLMEWLSTRVCIEDMEVIVYGSIEGNIESQRLEIKKDSCVIGDVFTKSLIVESGGTYIMEGVSWNSHLKIRYRNYPLKPR